MGITYALARERRLAELHKMLASEMGQSDYDGTERLSELLQASLWQLGAAVEESARLTTVER